MKKIQTQILFNLTIPSEQFDTITNDNLKEVMSNSPFSSQKLNYDKTLFETIHNSSVQHNPNPTYEKNITSDIIDVYLQKQSGNNDPTFIINEVFHYVFGYDAHPTKFTALPTGKQQQQLLYVIQTIDDISNDILQLWA